MPSSRPQRVGDQIRDEITSMLAREVKDPGIGFLTVTSVKVTADLQHARVYYTTLGDEKARKESARALDRALPFLRRQIAGRLRLRRAPELQFFFDDSVERHDRVERILQELEAERALHPPADETPVAATSETSATVEAEAGTVERVGSADGAVDPLTDGGPMPSGAGGPLDDDPRHEPR